jgi:hypothetical protein
MTHDLNDLILLCKDDRSAERGAIILQIDGKRLGLDGVMIQRGKGPSLLRRLWKASEQTRSVLVRTVSSIEMRPIQIDCEHIASEVTYRVTLKFDLQTPDAKDESALCRLGHAFRSATLETVGEAGHGSPADGPTGRFHREMTQWLRARYRAGGDLAQHADRNWLGSENTAIAGYIQSEFGLDAKVKLKIEVASELRLGPVTVAVETTPCDSDKVVKVPVTVSCVLVDRDVFTAPALTKADLQKRIEAQTDIFVRQHVTLQQYRFETEWIAALRIEIERDLKAFERRVTEFLVPLSQNAVYHKGPHAIRAGDAIFERQDRDRRCRPVRGEP